MGVYTLPGRWPGRILWLRFCIVFMNWSNVYWVFYLYLIHYCLLFCIYVCYCKVLCEHCAYWLVILCVGVHCDIDMHYYFIPCCICKSDVSTLMLFYVYYHLLICIPLFSYIIIWILFHEWEWCNIRAVVDSGVESVCWCMQMWLVIL